MTGRGAASARRALGAALWLLVLGRSAPADAYDPRLEWHTLASPHLEVHYPDGSYALAQDVAERAEAALARLSARLAWMPALPVHLVIDNETDLANGFAQAIPYNLVGLNNAAPTDLSSLADYDDWLDILVTHEMAHVVHIDTVLGLPRAFTAVFGRWLTPNGVQPRWMVEGLATYFESALTSAGRVRSSYTEMVLRTAALEGDFFDLGELSGYPRAWPQGQAAYLFGGRFLDYLVGRFGERSLPLLSYDYGTQLVPFALNVSARHVFERDYASLYGEFEAELRERARQEADAVERRGLREGVPLTHVGQDLGPARFAPDGTLYVVASPIDDHTALSSVTPDGRLHRVAWLQPRTELALVPGTHEAILTEVQVSEVYRLYGDLFRLDLTTGRRTRLTDGARVHGPDVSLDGADLVFVTTDGQHDRLMLAPVARPEAATPVVDFGGPSQIWTPRFSPDGKRIVFVAFVGGQRDLYLFDRDAHSLRRLTDDRALDGAPVFSHDGGSILFHSDRDGIYNLYAIPMAGGELRRVTRVVGGAFYPEPTPDGKALVYRSYSARGFDLSRLELPSLDALPATKAASYERPPAPHHASPTLYPSRDYSPWSTLRPRAWLPLGGVDTRGSIYGLTIQGADAVGLHAYILQAWYGTASRVPGFRLAYANRSFHPGFSVGLGRELGYAAVPHVRYGTTEGLEEDVWTASLSTNLPLWVTRDRSLSLVPSYAFEWHRARTSLVADPYDPSPVFPDEGRFASLGLQLAYSSVQSYVASISAETGTRIVLGGRYESPLVGSEYRSHGVTLSLTRYLKVPFLARHVLMLDAFGGFGASNYQRSRLFSIAGLPTRDLLLDAYSGRYSTSRALRGFPLVPYAGNAMVSSTLEYRLPLVDIERGIDTLPIYFRVLHGALFVDGAAIADKLKGLHRGEHASAGGELRLDIIAGYALPMTFRIGYGHALGREDYQSAFAVLGTSW